MGNKRRVSLEYMTQYYKDLFKEKIEKKAEEEMWKNCKCNNCVWAYKEAKYCPLGKCIYKGCC